MNARSAFTKPSRLSALRLPDLLILCAYQREVVLNGRGTPVGCESPLCASLVVSMWLSQGQIIWTSDCYSLSHSDTCLRGNRSTNHDALNIIGSFVDLATAYRTKDALNTSILEKTKATMGLDCI